jgi:hypothetical protein
MLDVGKACEELEFVLDRGARVICSRPGPLYGRSPADPYFDPFWSRVNETRIVVASHAIGGASPYDDMYEDAWCRPASSDHYDVSNLHQALFPGERPAMDTLTSKSSSRRSGSHHFLRKTWLVSATSSALTTC